MNMKLPKTIPIVGHLITVKRRKNMQTQNDSWGMFDVSTMEILIDADLKGTIMWETFWHEVIEAMNHFCEVGIEHKSIQVMGMILQQVTAHIAEDDK